MGDWTGTVPSIFAGDIPTGEDWAEIRGELIALSDAWSSYPVAWSSSGTQPAIGDGTLSGVYLRVGSLVMFRINQTNGGTTTYGTGTYSWSLPVAALSNSVAVCFLNDTGSTVRYRGVGTIGTVGTVTPVLFSDAVAGFTGTVPITLATTDIIRITGVYEA